MEFADIVGHWNQDAQNYGNIIDEELRSFRKEAWKKIFVENWPQGGNDVLDLGCGPGFFSILLAEMGMQVTGIDCAENMVALARENARKWDVSAEFLLMECEKLCFPENSFDVIVSRNVTWTMQIPETVYQSCRKLLRPGGKLMVFDANWYRHLLDPELAAEVRKRYKQCIKIYGDAFEGDQELTGKFSPEVLPLTAQVRPDWDVLALERVGFYNISVQKDISASLWSEKELLLYGASPLFFIQAEKADMH